MEAKLFYHTKIYKNTIRKQFIRISNKNFYEKFMKRKWSHYDQYPTHKEIKYYEVKDPLIFKNGKYLILETTHKLPSNLMEYGLFTTSVISTYKLISNIIRFKIIGSLIWGAILAMSYKGFNYSVTNRFYFIKEIYLLEDCQTLEVVTLLDKFNVNVANVRKITEDELQYYVNLVGDSEFIPLIINNQTFAISRKSLVSNNDIFKAITHGYYIKVTDDRKVTNDNYIDI